MESQVSLVWSQHLLSSAIITSEVVPFNSSDFKSLDYVINCAIRKIFLTNSNDVVLYCREIFGIVSARDIVSNRRKVFFSRFAKIDSLLSMSHP